jgi:mRNA interferase MazF
MEKTGEIFDLWNEEKKRIDSKKTLPLFREGELWWCRIGINVGREACGKGSRYARPILIMKKVSSDSCIVIPATSQKKTGTWFY